MELSRTGWQPLGPQPYAPLRYCARAFNLSKAQCRAECTSAANLSSPCRACDPLCGGAPIHRWRSPTGQTLETLTTVTDPPFVFAYNPYDTDMVSMRRNLIVEPTLTRVWHQTTWRCCSASNGIVVDVGGNYGWYTLYSLALGCSVVVFEPVPRYQEVMQLGLSLNPGFASRVTVFSNVVYDVPGEYALRVPNVNPKLMERSGDSMESRGHVPLGMTGMNGRAGVLKTLWSAEATTVKARAVRIDDAITRDVCLLKADVEGYEPQVFQTAAALLSRYAVPVLQLELTHTNDADQTCAMINMLEHLHGPLDYEMRQLSGPRLHRPLTAPPGVKGDLHFVGPARGSSWRTAPSAWRTLQRFPSRAGQNATWAFKRDFFGYSTNLVALRRSTFRPGATRPWPPLKCSEDAPTRPEPRADVDLSSKKSMRCSWLGAECVVETPAPATGAKASGKPTAAARSAPTAAFARIKGGAGVRLWTSSRGRSPWKAGR